MYRNDGANSNSLNRAGATSRSKFQNAHSTMPMVAFIPSPVKGKRREVGCFLSSLAVSLFSTEAFIVFVFDNGYQYGWLSLLIYCSHVKLITFLL